MCHDRRLAVIMATTLDEIKHSLMAVGTGSSIVVVASCVSQDQTSDSDCHGTECHCSGDILRPPLLSMEASDSCFTVKDCNGLSRVSE